YGQRLSSFTLILSGNAALATALTCRASSELERTPSQLGQATLFDSHVPLILNRRKTKATEVGGMPFSVAIVSFNSASPVNPT
ncbi:MAG TPA: hypothetical protein P5307_27110, partial [Pirellulaceae bacterium]|nr:hypothetical protein [Pirellulaceae bacterium]